MTAETRPPPLLSTTKNSISKEDSSCTEVIISDHSISSSTELWSDQCELAFNNLHTAPIAGAQFCLQNISGVAKPGEILAIMGQTGCGKTTLLNCISGRHPIVSGSIYVNEELLCCKQIRRRIGYVLQNDMFFPTLTLFQTLMYTALLRLSDVKFSIKDKKQKVEDIIESLDLYRCKDNPVGDGMTIGGLSGGEKKRLSIACELITNPRVLLIDEPTSGLDSFTATQLITTLRDFARKTNKNVIFTVHQPSSRMFQMFDTLLALSNGKTAYFGPADQMTTHMSNLGLVIPTNYNPADFLLEKLKYDEQKVIDGWKDHSCSQPKNRPKREVPIKTDGGGLSPSPSQPLWQTSFRTQVTVLTRRHIQLAIPRLFSKVNVIQSVILGLLAGFAWLRTPRDEESLTNLEGWMFFSSNYWMLFVLFQALWAFPSERPVIDKERLSGSYRFSAYYTAKVIAEVPLEICLPSLYLIISYPLIGGTFAAFFGILVSQVLSSLAAQSVGLFLGSVLDPAPAMTVAAIFTVAAQLLGGYLSTNIPTYFKIFSLVYNGLRNMQIVEFHYGDQIKCATGEDSDYAISQFKSCRANDTESFFIEPTDLLTRDESGYVFPLYTHTFVLLGFIVVFRILSYIALKRLP